MAKITLPRSKALSGGVLNNLANDLRLCSNPIPGSNNGDMTYEDSNQELFEDVLTHDNIMLIVNEGGDVEGYIMYAKIPYQIEVDTVMTPIYGVEVPEGLQYRQIKVCNGTSAPLITKTLGQWCNAQTTQSFSTDYQYIYVLTNPLGDYLTAIELKKFVDGYSATLLTRKQYALEDVVS